MILFRSNRYLQNISRACFVLFALMPLLCSADTSANSGHGRRMRPAADEQVVTDVANPRILNPIGSEELNRAKQFADSSDKVRQARLSDRRARGRVEGGQGATALERLETVQPLYVEHHDEEKNADPQSRRADVIYYDYSKNETIKVVVDLKNNKVEDTIVKPGSAHQPYFSRLEIQAAMQLIFDHPQMGPNLRKAYQDITGENLTDVSQLDAQGGKYLPDRHSKLGVLAASCVSDRCMQLFIPLDDTHFIDATNAVVNLSSGEVLWVKQGIGGHSH